jgi:hypothetical protein
VSHTDDLHNTERMLASGIPKDKEKRLKEKALLADLQNTADNSRRR